VEFFEVVIKLVGPVQPVGEPREDNRRLENMRTLIRLADKCLAEIHTASCERFRDEFAAKEIGIMAYKFLQDVHAAFEGDDDRGSGGSRDD